MRWAKRIQHGLVAIVCVVVTDITTAIAYADEQQAKTLAHITRYGNDEIINEKDFESYINYRIDLRAIARGALGVERVVQEMIFMRVLNLEGEQMKIPRPSVDAESGETPLLTRFDNVYALNIQKRLEPLCVRPSNAQQAREYFDANPQAFMLPAQARIQRIILPFDKNIEDQSALVWMQAKVRAIAAGVTTFADTVKQAEQAQPLELQGDLGWVQLNDDHSVLTALRDAREGELVGPLREGNSLYLFQITRKRPARPLAWEEVKSFAATHAESHCRESGEKQLRDRLFQKYGVKIDQAAIRAFVAQSVGGSER